jgi:TM2 domain-containing membrane protein YozV
MRTQTPSAFGMSELPRSRYTPPASPATHGASHSLFLGYVLWIFGFFGAHRFYYGRRVSGTIYFFTLGLLGVGWLFDLFLMPWLRKDAAERYHDGPYSYDVSWVLLTFGGIFGLHRFYLRQPWTGLLWLATGGLLGMGVLFDYLTLNEQVSLANREES